MRTGNLSALSEREWQAIRERRAFEKEYEEKQQLKDDKSQYAQYLATLDEEQRRVAPAHQIKAIPFETWRTYADASISDPLVRGAAATHKALLSTTLKNEADVEQAERRQAREAVSAGKHDPKWQLPESAKSLRVTKDKLHDFIQREGEKFVEHTPEFFPSKRNHEAISAYITEQGVSLPDEWCFKQAWTRLRELGLIEERPAPAPEPQVIDEPIVEPDPAALRQQKRQEYLTNVVVTDPRTGESYTEYQLDRLPADEYKRLMIGEYRTPRIGDVKQTAWYDN